jgi:hypothetical protein
VAGTAAERNLGLCRLWLGEEKAGVEALWRWSRHAQPTTENVDLAVVSLVLDESVDVEPVEHVQLTWPLRDRKTLLEVLIKDPSIIEGPDRHFDPNNEKSPQVYSFYLLDRAKVDARPGLSRQEIPLVLGEILIGSETVTLESHDDGRLDGLIDRFTALAGKAIPPAHPRTKVIGQTGRSAHSLSWHWYLPPELPEVESQRLSQEQIAHVMTEVWPETPLAFLDGRTPLQAAQSGRATILLRAAVLQMQLSGERWCDQVDWARFRARLKLEPEPAIDARSVKFYDVHLARLALIPLDQLDDTRLIELYLHLHHWGLADLLLKVAHEIVSRPGLTLPDDIEPATIYGELAMEAMNHRDRAGALEWLRRGRASEAPGRRAAAAPHWDMLEIRVKIQFDSITDWVTELAVVLGRYRGNEQAKLVLTAMLIQWGLLNVVPSADHPNEIQVDSRPLQNLMSMYGPKVTTSSGYVGVSATKGEIWTPESAAGGSAIWTPGDEAGAAAGGERPRIILPGQ